MRNHSTLTSDDSCLTASPVIIEVPHFASLRGKEREIVIMRSDNGETWYEHSVEATEEAIHQALNGSFEGEGDYISCTPAWMLMRDDFLSLFCWPFLFPSSKTLLSFH